jgi:hypothetical protein
MKLINEEGGRLQDRRKDGANSLGASYTRICEIN